MDVDHETPMEPGNLDQMDVGNIFRSIFTSCDIENTDSVRVSDLIEFIKPYLMEDLNALEDLRHSLDPTGTNICVNSERFYEVIGQWSQKLGSASSSGETEFDKSPSLLTVMDDNSLPYLHSTPRASLGDKLLKCKDLLNLSNVSGYSLSTSRLDNPETDRTILEEEVKKLQHQLQKTSDELFLTKQQLTIVEEQNEQLQQDLVRINRRLHEEQQVNKHLQKDMVLGEDLREELSNYKKSLEELKKKLSQSEKDSLYQKDCINELNEEKIKFEKKSETLSKRLQDCLKELSDVKIELQTKDAQVIQATKDFNELKKEFSDQKDFIDQLREENELLCHQKLTLEKTLKAKLSNSPQSNLGNFLLELSTPSPKPHTPNQNKSQPIYKPVPLLRRVLSRQNSAPGLSSGSSSDDSPPNTISRIPVLNTNRRDSSENTDQPQESSEEDLSWRLQMGTQNTSETVDFDRTTESLRAEMNRADHAVTNEETYNTVLFERDELIVELEYEIEKQKSELKKLEEQLNESLIKEGQARNEIETLKQRLGQLEQNSFKEEEEENELFKNYNTKLENITEESISDITNQSNTERKYIEDKSLMDKVAQLERDNEEISHKNKELEEEVTRYHEDKSKLQIELVEFKENLEKRLVAEFEDKVKYSIEAEESFLNLTQKCNKLQEELSDLSKTVINKNKSLTNAENQLVLLTNQNVELQKEIDALNESKTELELKVVRMRTEHGHSLSKINNIDMMATEIQSYIHEKNDIIRELKQLNRKLEVNLREAQLDLKKQVEDTMELRNELIKGLDVKNELWKSTCSLEADRRALTSQIKQVNENYQILFDSNKELTMDYNNLLVVYDVEVNKNSKLVSHIDKLETEKDELNIKLTETAKEKQNLEKSISELKPQISGADKKSKASQTAAHDNISDIEEAFSKAEEAGKQLLDELLIKFNKEVEKNRCLTNEMIDLKNNYTKSNVELNEIKCKLADNEDTMHKKLEQNCHLLEKMNQKEIEIEKELKQNKCTLEKAEKTNLLLNKELKEIERKYESLVEELNRTKEHLHQKDLEINNLTQTKLKDKEQFENELTKMKLQLQNKQTELENLEHKNELTTEALNMIQIENNQHIERLQQELLEKNKQIKNIQTSNIQLQKDSDVTKQEKEALNRELANLKKSFLATEKNKTDRLQEEICKNKALFENFCALKKERDQLSFNLKEAQALLSNNHTLYNKKHNDLQELQNKYSLIEAKLLNLQTQFEKAERDIETITSQRDLLLAETDKLKALSVSDREANTGRTYFKQQITIQKLKDKIEDLEDQLKTEKIRYQQLKCTTLPTNIAQPKSEQPITERNVEEPLKIEDVKREEAVRNVVDIGIQVQEYDEEFDRTSEGKPLSKFTVSSRSESPDSPSPDLELINLANLKDYAYSSKFVYNSQGDSILEVPSIDVQGFADDIINDLDLNDSSPRKKFEREELESTVTALILRLVANSSNISSRIEKQTEEYRRQYEAILVLLNDISYRLRDHICIGTAEPIKPVYLLLEDIKQQLRGLVQNAGQVGVLICEDRTKRCWNLVVNYVALLRQDNEAFRNTSRASTPTQTGLRQRTKSTQEEADLTKANLQSKGRSGRRSKLALLLLFVIAFSLALCMAIDLNCRMTASENQYCPLDAIAQRINVGLPPM